MPEELDFAVIKETAFRMGISHRADIKPETLQARIDKKREEDAEKVTDEPEEVNEAEEAIETVGSFYINTTNQNIFTSAGRCKPQGKITIPQSEADNTAGLEKCKGQSDLALMQSVSISLTARICTSKPPFTMISHQIKMKPSAALECLKKARQGYMKMKM